MESERTRIRPFLFFVLEIQFSFMMDAVEFKFFQKIIKHTLEKILMKYKIEKAIFSTSFQCFFNLRIFCYYQDKCILNII